jgi:hypothetical protein
VCQVTPTSAVISLPHTAEINGPVARTTRRGDPLATNGWQKDRYDLSGLDGLDESSFTVGRSPGWEWLMDGLLLSIGRALLLPLLLLLLLPLPLLLLLLLVLVKPLEALPLELAADEWYSRTGWFLGRSLGKTSSMERLADDNGDGDGGGDESSSTRVFSDDGEAAASWNNPARDDSSDA